MGLAGMYFVLLPAHKVHVAAWMRFGIFAGFRLFYRLFAVRGFWIVLFYIAFDAAAVTWRVESNVGHWAHLGGFIAGMVVALVLLVSRLVNCRGGDLLTMQLGRRAWPLVGKPDLLRPTRIAQWG
jgi:membrane associated rhomboid family serine protease